MEILEQKTVRRLVFNFENFSGRDELPQPTIEKVELTTVEKDGRQGRFLRILNSSPFSKPMLVAQFA